LGENFAIVCTEAIDKRHRKKVLTILKETKQDVLEVTLD